MTILIDNMPLDAKAAQICDAIANVGYAITEQFLSPLTVNALASEARQLQLAGRMQRASTGKTTRLPNEEIRGDLTHWLEGSEASNPQREYLSRMENLRTELNKSLFLGLFELESHFAIYPPGAFYRKHLDQFQGYQQRQISCILYLNKNWQAEDGGQLRLYLDGAAPEPYQDIKPVAGTLVTFLSGRFFHEVLPAKRERISFTGWFRTRSDQPV